MSFFLRKIGLAVVSYDIQDVSRNSILKKLEVYPIVNYEPTILPFLDNTFDAVLSCGVLEHVPDEQNSLMEIRRILKKGGYFFIYRLPNKYSYAEFLATVRNKSCHPVKYTPTSIEANLQKAGFNVLRIKRENIIPKNLSFLPLGLKKVFNWNYNMWYYFEKIFLKIPIITIFSGCLNIIAKKDT